jgi:hypothetical protein
VASAATLSIYPPIYGPGSHYQNVDALPGNTAALTLWPGTTIVAGAAKTGKVAVALYPGAFLIAGVPLEEPKGSVEFCRQVSGSDDRRLHSHHPAVGQPLVDDDHAPRCAVGPRDGPR